MEYINTQKLMTLAYEKWVSPKDINGMSHHQFMMNLAPAERRAVVIGNLNYQVENGGFDQWHGNGYSKDLLFLEDALETINTETSKEVLSIVKSVMSALKSEEFHGGDFSYNLDECDNKYYVIKDKFLNDVESFFSAHMEI